MTRGKPLWFIPAGKYIVIPGKANLSSYIPAGEYIVIPGNAVTSRWLGRNSCYLDIQITYFGIIANEGLFRRLQYTEKKKLNVY